MIGQLRGQIVDIFGNVALIDVQGVGYEVISSRNLLSKLERGQEATFPVFTEVREDALRLFGFIDRGEKQLFLLLTKVNGLGAKSSLDIVSQVDKRTLLRAIGSGDIAGLTSVRGIGKKKAERIVVELKDIVLQVGAEISSQGGDEVGGSHSDLLSAPTGALHDALQALQVLGFSRRDAEKALKDAVEKVGDRDSGALIREALRAL